MKTDAPLYERIENAVGSLAAGFLAGVVVAAWAVMLASWCGL